VRWLIPAEKELALKRMRDAGKGEEVAFTWQGIKRIFGKWHFWVYTAYYT
jgi:ACS family pantothenate transporter-like MFS transporter